MVEETIRQQSGAGQHVRHTHFHDAVRALVAAGLALAHQRHRTGAHGVIDKARSVAGGAAAGHEDLARPE